METPQKPNQSQKKEFRNLVLKYGSINESTKKIYPNKEIPEKNDEPVVKFTKLDNLPEVKFSVFDPQTNHTDRIQTTIKPEETSQLLQNDYLSFSNLEEVVEYLNKRGVRGDSLPDIRFSTKMNTFDLKKKDTYQIISNLDN
ncbi:hypothetical protein M0813_16769 [Anaeramoeba flamelloides]|uniref:Uncharacterized protein n=1 Tax=Anaeramoeba flamelloides TaxID=1746091 RepID=A0AAV7ZKN9_9EUKA|nr:hypothetical protein M0812_12321 [Anaeramoeba flamelloides]KAJ6249695.1 hypothetical protein M0813_16769 [Anaeramoeba flamelloides]